MDAREDSVTEGRGVFTGEPALIGDPHRVLSRFIGQLTF